MSNQEQLTQNYTVDDDRNERLATHDILDTAAASGEFTRFLTAVRETGLEGLLRSPDLVTVFLPANSAFDAVGTNPGTGVDAARLGDIIRYHVAPGALTAAELATASLVNTAQGIPLRVVNENGELRVGGARVIRPDLNCTNGVAHVIDRVLTP